MEKRESQQEIKEEDHTKKDLKRTAENAPAHHAPVVEGVIHAPLMRASSLPAQLTDDEVSTVSLEVKRRRMRRMNKPHVTFVENEVSKGHAGSSSEIDSSERGSNNPNLQTEGRGEANRNAVAAASQGRPPRSPIAPPPAQRMKPDSMPYVYTTGPSGRRVYGFLYRFWAPDSKIMCVCHGEFFTPGQFVEHGGGGVVENPNRHIIVTPFPFRC